MLPITVQYESSNFSIINSLMPHALKYTENKTK